MGRLIYSAIASVDGYIADEHGEFGWAAPDVEVHGFINDLVRSVEAFLYGRRMYQTMTAWEADPAVFADTPVMADFARIWRSADKVVYSTTLPAVTTGRTALERRFDPEAVRKLKASAPGDIGIGGPGLAAHAFRNGLVDEYCLFLAPVAVGAGTKALPDGLNVQLALADERRFGNGMVFLRYQVTPNP